jgi:hypothetical protein
MRSSNSFINALTLFSIISIYLGTARAGNDQTGKLFTVGSNCNGRDLDSMVAETIDMAQNAIDTIDNLINTPNIVPGSSTARVFQNARHFFGVESGWFSGITQSSIDNLRFVQGKSLN